MSTFFQDLRLGWRLIHRDPGLTLVIILSLGLGIGGESLQPSRRSAPPFNFRGEQAPTTGSNRHLQGLIVPNASSNFP
jgi:hypothetical protein